MAMYDKFGFGLWHAALKSGERRSACAGCSSATSCPMSTWVMRSCRSSGARGSRHEAAAATLRHGAQKFGLTRVIGVVSEGNAGSIRVLEKLGMSFERMFSMRADEPDVRLYGLQSQRRVTESPMTLPIFAPCIDAQLHRPIEAQFAFDHAGSADVHLDGARPCPNPSCCCFSS